MPFIYVTGEWLLLLVYLGKDYIEHITNQKVNYSNEQLRTNNSTNIFSLESLRLENLHIYICLSIVGGFTSYWGVGFWLDTYFYKNRKSQVCQNQCICRI